MFPARFATRPSASVSEDQIAEAIQAGLQNDVDPKVRLTLLLRVAEGNAKMLSMETYSLAYCLRFKRMTFCWMLGRLPLQPIRLRRSSRSQHWMRQARMPSANVFPCWRNTSLEIVLPRNKSVGYFRSIRIRRLPSTVWEGLAKGWPRDLTISLPEESQKLVRDRFLAEDTSVESKAAILAVADKWSIENLNDIVGEIQDELLTTAMDTDAEANRLNAWDQSIRLAPNSPKILDAVDAFFTPQLSPETGIAALAFASSRPGRRACPKHCWTCGHRSARSSEIRF